MKIHACEREKVDYCAPESGRQSEITLVNQAIPRLAIDSMGTDAGPTSVVEGVAKALQDGLRASVTFFGDQSLLESLVGGFSSLKDAKIEHAEASVSMTDKPMHVLRRGRNTSMWAALQSVAEGSSDAVVSGGNTGALMAVARRQLGMIEGIERPAITALWPTPRGRVVVLDVGANVEASARQLVEFAIMGEAFFRVLTDKSFPTVGLLNVGAEELKGHDLIRRAASVLREADPEMDFKGFVEGNDISLGAVDEALKWILRASLKAMTSLLAQLMWLLLMDLQAMSP